jgi:hypothetical protein
MVPYRYSHLPCEGGVLQLEAYSVKKNSIGTRYTNMSCRFPVISQTITCVELMAVLMFGFAEHLLSNRNICHGIPAKCTLYWENVRIYYKIQYLF